MSLYHFYHIYAAGNWQQPVAEHVRALKDYGLYANLTSLHIGLVGNTEQCAAVKQYLNEQGLTYTIADEQPSGWEQVTQIPMWEFSKHHDGLMLYAHSKGASDWNEVNVRWRRSMTYWNVVRWQLCLEKLETHDACGCHWIYPLISMPEHKYGNPMFAGNFYWVRSEQLKTWMRVPLTHRHESEGWVGYKYAEKPFPLYDFTPYFPNSDTFADEWVNNPGFNYENKGRSI